MGIQRRVDQLLLDFVSSIATVIVVGKDEARRAGVSFCRCWTLDTDRPLVKG